jgi:hypothetical protein
MIDEVRVALTAVRTGTLPAPGDLVVVDLSDISGVLLGVDDLRRPHMLLELADVDPPPSSSDTATLEIGERTLVMSGLRRRFVDVTCLFQAVADVFEHFISAVAERLQADASTPVSALNEVLERWHQFLLPAAGPVGRTKLAAVMGELLVLRDIMHADPTRSVDIWIGPFGGRHDFRRGPRAIEVKTTRSHTSRDVTIHGEDQLEAPSEGALHLHFVRLEEVPSGGESVASVVDDLLSTGVAADALFHALAAAGIPIAELSATGDVSFEVRERLTVPVDDELPRIVPESFAAGARPTGVLDLSYVISLDHAIERTLSEADYHELIGDLAGRA